jgi:hypothetical protein
MKDELARKQKVQEIEDRLNTFAGIEHIQLLKDTFLPKIEKLCDKIDEFQQENLNVRECVIHFDQSLSLKANKNEFMTFKENLRSEFIPIDYMDKLDK